MLNEFRQDLVSGEWVLFATGRAKRPAARLAEAFGVAQAEIAPVFDKPGQVTEGIRQKAEDVKDKGNIGIGTACPFEDPEGHGNEVLKTYPGETNSETWFAKVAKNKFPAVIEGEAGPRQAVGPFSVTEARGLHELVIYGDHDRQLHEYSAVELGRVFGIYQERYRAMAGYSTSKYVLIFHNKGTSAGASLVHPHSQIISIPILPPDVKRSIFGAQRFYSEHGQRVYDLMIDWEIKEARRIVYQTENFIAFCPFVSKTPYEVRIFSKTSHSHFEHCPIELLPELGEVVGKVLTAVDRTLPGADFNFFIHTAPVEKVNDADPHQYYSWHIEILPKLSLTGGFELGSGVTVNIIDPDQAAEEFRHAL